MYTNRTKIVAFACVSRFSIIAVQFIANLIIPDHSAEVFTYPKENLTSSFFDETVTVLLGGFIRWDAQYFMHIAKYGYTYENALAFFPLYPLIVKAIATLTSYFVVFLNEDSILIITFILLNLYLFIKAAITLYELSSVVLTKDLAYKAVILFCINPATIFFVAPYSECLFSYLTFKSMLNCMLMYDKYSTKSDKRLSFKSIINVIVPLSLSTCVRSNGILNIGFIAYFMIQSFFKNIHLLKSVKDKIFSTIKCGILLLSIVLMCLIPFALVQIYAFHQFCTNFVPNIPDFLIDFGNNNDFVLPGMVSKYKQEWCFKKVPLAYSYIQDHYWNVGFLRYFEIKQIPNFILAFPIVIFIVTNSAKFFMQHKNYCINLGIFEFNFACLKNSKFKAQHYFKPEMFVFVVHALFLTLFCVMCIHVQVTTRMICSASPIVYWFAAYQFKDDSESGNLYSNTFLFNSKSKLGQYVFYYFITYSFLGTVLFSNFLPWT